MIDNSSHKPTMHIDTSCKLYENKNTGISCKIAEFPFHKGLTLTKKLKKELKRDFNVDHDYARVYAICIYYLIKDEIEKFDSLVICNDENYNYVKKYLDLLFRNNPAYFKKEIISLAELRRITGRKKLKSCADNAARSYRKRGLKSLNRRQEGKELNVVKISYKNIKEKWEEIESLMKNVSGE